MAAVSQGTVSTARTTARTMEDLDDPQTKIGYAETRVTHPRLQYEDFAIPQWLKNYECVYFDWDTDDQTMIHAVHKLYHVVLDNIIDRIHMANAIAVGETFAIVRRSPTGDKPIAVAAVTYAVIGSKVLVLYIGIDSRYQNAGFGSQLLKTMGASLQCRVEEDPEQDGNQAISVFLFANEEQNQKAWKFCMQRGFMHAPSLLSESIQEFMDDDQ